MSEFIYCEAPSYRGMEAVKNSIREHGIDAFAKNLFLAGSITGTEDDWQRRVSHALKPCFNVFNPRRESFDTSKLDESKIQITWEYDHLKFCPHILFWFSHETLAPITLFEYGKVLEWVVEGILCKDDVYVGIHPDYQRKFDVEIQTGLVSKEMANKICYSLEDLVELAIKGAGRVDEEIEQRASFDRYCQCYG